jgi:hypothetical protein
VVDGNLFEGTPTAATVEGRVNHVPILTGATTDESFTQSDNLDSEMKFWYPALSKKDVAALSELYPDSDFLSHQDAVTAAVGQTLNRCGVSTHHQVWGHAKGSSNSGRETPW